MLRQVCAALVLLSATAVGAEIVTTTDGRQIELKPDGTYEEIAGADAVELVLTEKAPFFEHFVGEYDQKSMRFMPIFRNETEKTIVGFKFRTTFSSAFGDEVFAFEGESSERILAGGSSTASAFYYFEDNKFIGDQPYDKLMIFEGAGTGRISTKITAVVFEGGEVVKASP